MTKNTIQISVCANEETALLRSLWLTRTQYSFCCFRRLFFSYVFHNKKETFFSNLQTCLTIVCLLDEWMWYYRRAQNIKRGPSVMRRRFWRIFDVRCVKLSARREKSLRTSSPATYEDNAGQNKKAAVSFYVRRRQKVDPITTVWFSLSCRRVLSNSDRLCKNLLAEFINRIREIWQVIM